MTIVKKPCAPCVQKHCCESEVTFTITIQRTTSGLPGRVRVHADNAESPFWFAAVRAFNDLYYTHFTAEAQTIH